MVAMAVLKAIVSLYRAGEEKPIERYKSRVKVAEENKLFSSFQKKYWNYPAPQTEIPFKDVRFMTSLPPDELSEGEEQTLNDWLENYRPVRQRTVRMSILSQKN